MGTRADFYVGRGEQAEWLGSIAWDGYPPGVFDNMDVLRQVTEEDAWRHHVSEFLAIRDDSTLPEAGWPWPWEDSGTTDYAYAFDGGQVWGSGFGTAWFVVADGEPEADDRGPETATFPNMKERQNVRWDSGSGLLVIALPPTDS